MAKATSQAFQNIRSHANDLRSTQEASMDVEVPRSDRFEKRLDRTIRELQGRVEQQKAALETLRASSAASSFAVPSSDDRERLGQLRTLKSMYDGLIPTEPLLPHPESLLPAVLAVKTVQDTIVSTKKAVSDTRNELSSKELQLKREKADLEDDREIQTHINARIGRLKTQKAASSKKSAHQLANELVGAKQKRKLDFESDTLRLHDALIDFIKDHLGAMLAAEELGGPVVGDLMDIDDEVLAQKSIKAGTSKSKPLDDATRQERIEQIWGHLESTEGTFPETERDAAGREVHMLIEKLITALIGRSSTGVYITLDRESAAARFLVRAKVAQFHPKDARRLRLVDFGRELGQ